MAEEQQVAEAPVETGQAPSEDWKASLPDDIKGNQLIHNLESVEALAKTAIHAQSMVGADKVPVPGKWANDDDWNSVYTKLGKPENAEGYKLEVKEGTKVVFVGQGVTSDNVSLPTYLTADGTLRSTDHELGITLSHDTTTMKTTVTFTKETPADGTIIRVERANDKYLKFRNEGI